MTTAPHRPTDGDYADLAAHLRLDLANEHDKEAFQRLKVGRPRQSQDTRAGTDRGQERIIEGQRFVAQATELALSELSQQAVQQEVACILEEASHKELGIDTESPRMRSEAVVAITRWLLGRALMKSPTSSSASTRSVASDAPPLANLPSSTGANRKAAQMEAQKQGKPPN